jgi:single-stranded-DNA-specific exonuclease
MVPLRNENRLIVRRGLNALIHKPRYGLSELLLILGLSGKKITAEELSWILCPAINAAGRMGAPDKAVALLLETDPLQRLSLAGELKAMNEKRKRLGAKTGPFVERLATESIARFDNKLVVAAGEAINRGITGVMANRLIDRFHIPAMAVCLGEELAIGSIRSPGNYNIRLLLEPLDDLLLNYGGHANALGFRVRRSLWDQFLDRLEIELAYIDCVSIPEHTAVTVDAELPQSYLTPDLLTLVDRFAPYGTGNEPLVFYSRNLPVISITLMGKREPKHAKFIPDTGRHKWPAIFWKVPEQVRQTINVGDTVDVRYTLNRDCYRGLEIPQIIIKDIGVRSGFP